MYEHTEPDAIDNNTLPSVGYSVDSNEWKDYKQTSDHSPTNAQSTDDERAFLKANYFLTDSPRALDAFRARLGRTFHNDTKYEPLEFLSTNCSKALFSHDTALQGTLTELHCERNLLIQFPPELRPAAFFEYFQNFLYEHCPHTTKEYESELGMLQYLIKYHDLVIQLAAKRNSSLEIRSIARSLTANWIWHYAKTWTAEIHGRLADANPAYLSDTVERAARREHRSSQTTTFLDIVKSGKFSCDSVPFVAQLKEFFRASSSERSVCASVLQLLVDKAMGEPVDEVTHHDARVKLLGILAEISCNCPRYQAEICEQMMYLIKNIQ